MEGPNLHSYFYSIFTSHLVFKTNFPTLGILFIITAIIKLATKLTVQTTNTFIHLIISISAIYLSNNNLICNDLLSSTS